MTPSKKQDEESFEKLLGRLESIVEKLDSGDVPLEKSLALYEEGIGIARQCADRLAQIELKIQTLRRGAGDVLELLDEEDTIENADNRSDE